MVQGHDQNCYGCSASNPLSLNVKFKVEGDRVVGEFDSTPGHIGPPDIVHGGIIAALMDEAMAYVAIHLLKRDSRTAKQEIVYKNSARTGDKIYVEAHLKEEKSRAFIVGSKVYSGPTTIAEGTGMLMKVK